MLEVALLLAVFAVNPQDLPPGAAMRLGDARFRAGLNVNGLVLSPDGQQLATWRETTVGIEAITIWDANTGRPLFSREVNSNVFFGAAAWGVNGGIAMVARVDLTDDTPPQEKFIPGDFRVWNFTNPKATPPPLVTPVGGGGFGGLGRAVAEEPEDSLDYQRFILSADGKRGGGIRTSADGEKCIIDMFELRPALTSAASKRICSIDMGDEADTDRIELSADGKTLLGIGVQQARDNGESEVVVTVWDVATMRPTCTLKVKTTGFVRPSPDGRTLIVNATDDAGDGFDAVELPTGKRRKLSRIPLQVPSPEMNIESREVIAFYPSGKAFVFADGCRAVVVDLANGKELGQLKGHATAVAHIAVSADGKRIATVDTTGLIMLWDAATLRPLREPHGHRAAVLHAELSPDGKHLLTWSSDETIRIWDMSTGKELRVFTGVGAIGQAGDESSFQRPAFTPDGRTVIFATKDRTVARDINTGREVPLPGDLAKLKAAFVVFSPDGKAVLAWAPESTSLVVLDWPSGKQRFAVEGHEVREPGFSADGSIVFSRVTDTDCWDAKTGKPIPAPDTDMGNVVSLRSLRPAAHVLDLMGGDPPRLVHAGTGARVLNMPFTLPVGDESWSPFDVAVCPNGRHVAAVSLGDESELLIYEASTGELRRKIAGPSPRTRILGFTPDGSRLLTTGDDHSVLVWDMRASAVPLPSAFRHETNFAKLWATMNGRNGEPAHLAMSRLAREPDAAVKLARQHLKPAIGPNSVAIVRHLRDLGDEEFHVREQAQRELEMYGEAGVELVKKLLPNLLTPEARQRADGYLRRWGSPGMTGPRLQQSRAIELLESLGTSEASDLLRELAGGEASAWRTQEAKRALPRLPK